MVLRAAGNKKNPQETYSCCPFTVPVSTSRLATSLPGVSIIWVDCNCTGEILDGSYIGYSTLAGQTKTPSHNNLTAWQRSSICVFNMALWKS